MPPKFSRPHFDPPAAPRSRSSAGLGVALAVGIVLDACGHARQDAPIEPLGAGAASLVGPVAALDQALAAWVFEHDYTCDPPPEGEPRPAPPIRETARWTGQGPLLEARLVRVRGDIACAPIEYCVLAIRSERGWWVPPADQNAWCSGVTGPSSRIETVDERLIVGDDRGARLIHRGLRRTHLRSYDADPDGNGVESWSGSRAAFQSTCGLLADDRVGCIHHVDDPSEP